MYVCTYIPYIHIQSAGGACAAEQGHLLVHYLRWSSRLSSFCPFCPFCPHTRLFLCFCAPSRTPFDLAWPPNPSKHRHPSLTIDTRTLGRLGSYHAFSTRPRRYSLSTFVADRVESDGSKVSTLREFCVMILSLTKKNVSQSSSQLPHQPLTLEREGQTAAVHSGRRQPATTSKEANRVPSVSPRSFARLSSLPTSIGVPSLPFPSPCCPTNLTEQFYQP
jgi:hypothetical protein